MSTWAYTLAVLYLFTNSALAKLAEPDHELYANHWIIIEDISGEYGKLTWDEVNHRLVATHYQTKTVDFFDTNSNALLARTEVGEPIDSGYCAKTGNYYIALNESKIVIISGKTFEKTGYIAIPSKCGEMCIDDTRQECYVLNSEGHSLWVIDISLNKIIYEIKLPGSPQCLLKDVESNFLYVGLDNDKAIYAIDCTSRKIKERLATGSLAPSSILYDKGNANIYASGTDGYLVRFDIKKKRLVDEIKIPLGVKQIAMDPDLGRLYCASPDWLVVIKTNQNTMQILDQIYTATGGTNVVVDLKRHAVWTTFTDGEDSYAKSFTSSEYIDKTIRY